MRQDLLYGRGMGLLSCLLVLFVGFALAAQSGFIHLGNEENVHLSRVLLSRDLWTTLLPCGDG